MADGPYPVVSFRLHPDLAAYAARKGQQRKKSLSTYCREIVERSIRRSLANESRKDHAQGD